MFLNISQNSFPYGIDVAGAFPKYFTAKRAAFMLLIITMIIQPWRFLSQAAIFLTILSSITRKLNSNSKLTPWSNTFYSSLLCSRNNHLAC